MQQRRSRGGRRDLEVGAGGGEQRVEIMGSHRRRGAGVLAHEQHVRESRQLGPDPGHLADIEAFDRDQHAAVAQGQAGAERLRHDPGNDRPHFG